MSDFLNHGWSIFIAAVTVAGIAACLALLVIASRRKVMSSDNTTGHVWDGDLREMNNPLPRWWMVLFVLTIVFAGGYLTLYPGLGARAGSLGWSSAGQVQVDLAKQRQTMAPIYARFTGVKAEVLAHDPRAMAIGERLFANNCAGCHGADARGSKGFPNLTDTDWLWGGSPERIEETITKGRVGQMPAIAQYVGTSEDVRNVAHYVMSLSGSPYDSIRAAAGKPKFAICAGCHGMDGKGNQLIGAPNLTDDVWLHGWGEEAIVAIVTNGKTNIMPAHEKRLTPEQIHVLASYVWSLSHQGEPSVTTADPPTAVATAAKP
ncbi:MAG: cytochrome-c oxidase, cbb3-type subunit III [Paucibacter sp.]|nr:cytochrome-c oxidase, cbb3-type subunit III [Roseateles sp.]